MLSGAQIVVSATGGVLYAGIHCFLEGLNLGVGLGSIRLNAVSGCGEPPGAWNELTSYPRWKWVNPGRSEPLGTRTPNWNTMQTRNRLRFDLWMRKHRVRFFSGGDGGVVWVFRGHDSHRRRRSTRCWLGARSRQGWWSRGRQQANVCPWLVSVGKGGQFGDIPGKVYNERTPKGRASATDHTHEAQNTKRGRPTRLRLGVTHR